MDKFGLLMAVAAYFIVGALVSSYFDSQSACFWGLVAAGAAFFHWSGKRPDDLSIHKRVYAMELAPLAEAINQHVTSGFYGDSQWTLQESSNLARGYLHFTINWNESWTAEALPKRSGFAFKTGHLEIKFDDVTTEIEKPRMSGLFLFQDNSAVSKSHFNHIIEKTMQRLDCFIPEHEKVQMSPQEVSGLAVQ